MSNRPSQKTPSSAKVRKAAAAGRSNRTMWLWIGVVVVVVVAGVVAIAVSSSSSKNSSSGGRASPAGGTVVPNGNPTNQPVTVTGTALPMQPQDTTTPDPAIGKTIPTVTGETFDGSKITISPTDGPQIVMGIAHWCPHCQAEIPKVQQWLDQNGMPKDVAIHAIATANDPTRGNYPAGDWLRGLGFSVPTILDNNGNQAANAFGVGGFPYFLVVDANGKVVTRVSGEIPMTTFAQLIDAARTGTYNGSTTGGASSSAG